MKFLLYGLQRSGTNYLETLLKKKYRVQILNNGRDRSSPLHKHFRLYDEKEIIPEPQYRNELKITGFKAFEGFLKIVPDYYLIISKDPYSWLLSYNDWAEKCGWTAVSHHYLQEYNLFYGKWLALARQTDRILFLRYLDLLQDSGGELRRLEAIMPLKKRFSSAFRFSLRNRVPNSAEFSAGRRQFYLHKEYLKRYSALELHEISAVIDPLLLSQLGYTSIENNLKLT